MLIVRDGGQGLVGGGKRVGKIVLRFANTFVDIHRAPIALDGIVQTVHRAIRHAEVVVILTVLRIYADSLRNKFCSVLEMPSRKLEHTEHV